MSILKPLLCFLILSWNNVYSSSFSYLVSTPFKNNAHLSATKATRSPAFYKTICSLPTAEIHSLCIQGQKCTNKNIVSILCQFVSGSTMRKKNLNSTRNLKLLSNPTVQPELLNSPFISMPHDLKKQKLRRISLQIDREVSRIHKIIKLQVGMTTKRDYQDIVRSIRRINIDYNDADFEYYLLNRLADAVEQQRPTWVEPRISKEHLLKIKSFKDPIFLVKTYDRKQFRRICTENIRHNSVVVQPKIDGVSCSLWYVRGRLHSAFSKRGYGNGIDLSEKVRYLSSVPKMLDKDFTGVIRGELFVDNVGHTVLKLSSQPNSKAAKATSLSCIQRYVGSKKKLWSLHKNIAQFIPFHISQYRNRGFHELSSSEAEDQSETYTLQDLGFKNNIDQCSQKYSSVKDVMRAIFLTRRSDYPFETDGIIIKNTSGNRLGYAYKYHSTRKKSPAVNRKKEKILRF